MACLFCKIINKEITAEIVYEDDSVIAFLDINPVNTGHTLVVPKNHCENLLDVGENDLQKLVAVIPRLAKAVVSAGGYEGFNCFCNNGQSAGQVIGHLHFHIVPRTTGDGYEFKRGALRSDDELKVDAEKIREHLNILRCDSG